MQSSSAISFSPSFNSYSSGKLAEIAARVVEEFRAESVSNDYDDDMYNFKQDEYGKKMSTADEGRDRQPRVEETEDGQEAEDDDDDDDDEFEFAFVCREPDSSPISADEIFYNGQIKPVFPLFNTDLLLEHGIDVANSINSKPPVRLSLRKLFIEERDSPSCSSSEADELDGASPGTYCVWRPKTPEESPDRCKKSNSTGNSSKRWKFKDLLHRSHSDGKDTFVFLTPSGSKKRIEKTVKVEKSRSVKVNENVKEKVDAGVGDGVLSATEAQKPMKRASSKESERRRSYLPYKPDLVGLFANVNGLSRNLHPF